MGKLKAATSKLRKLTPSTNQFMVLAVLFLFVYSRAEGDDLPSFFFYSFVAVLIAAWIWSADIVNKLKYTTEMETDRSQVGHSFSLDVAISNNSYFSVPWLGLNVAIPPEFGLIYGNRNLALAMSRRETRTFTYQVLCKKRGYYLLGSAKARLGDIFGVFVRDRLLKAPRTVIVYPKIVPLDRVAVPSFQPMGSSYTLRGANEDLTGPTGARKYVHGDPVNRIHWRATARTGQLQVKEYDLHTTPEMGICLDLTADNYAGVPEDTVETVVTLAASLANYCAKSRFRYGLVTNGSSIFVQPPSRDSGQLSQILEHLALVQPGSSYSFSQTVLLESRNFVRGTTLVLVTPRVDERLGGIVKILMQRGYGLAIAQVGPAQARPEYLEGVRYLAGITDENLAQVLGGDSIGTGSIDETAV